MRSEPKPSLSSPAAPASAGAGAPPPICPPRPSLAKEPHTYTQGDIRYRVTRLLEEALEQPRLRRDLSSMDLAQIPPLIKRLKESRGFCAGYTLVVLHGLWVDHHCENPRSNLDSYSYFLSILRQIIMWDKEQRVESIETIIRWMNRLLDYQRWINQYPSLIEGYTPKIKLPYSPTFEMEFSIGGCFNANKLERFLPQITPPNRLIFITFHEHSIGLFKINGTYYLVDANVEEGVLSFSESNIRALSAKITGAFTLYRVAELGIDWPMNIRIYAARGTTPYRYPCAKTLLQNLYRTFPPDFIGHIRKEWVIARHHEKLQAEQPVSPLRSPLQRQRDESIVRLQYASYSDQSLYFAFVDNPEGVGLTEAVRADSIPAVEYFLFYLVHLIRYSISTHNLSIMFTTTNPQILELLMSIPVVPAKCLESAGISPVHDKLIQRSQQWGALFAEAQITGHANIFFVFLNKRSIVFDILDRTDALYPYALAANANLTSPWDDQIQLDLAWALGYVLNRRYKGLVWFLFKKLGPNPLAIRTIQVREFLREAFNSTGKGSFLPLKNDDVQNLMQIFINTAEEFSQENVQQELGWVLGRVIHLLYKKGKGRLKTHQRHFFSFLLSKLTRTGVALKHLFLEFNEGIPLIYNKSGQLLLEETLSAILSESDISDEIKTFMAQNRNVPLQLAYFSALIKMNLFSRIYPALRIENRIASIYLSCWFESPERDTDIFLEYLARPVADREEKLSVRPSRVRLFHYRSCDLESIPGSESEGAGKEIPMDLLPPEEVLAMQGIVRNRLNKYGFI